MLHVVAETQQQQLTPTCFELCVFHYDCFNGGVIDDLIREFNRHRISMMTQAKITAYFPKQ